MRPFTLKDSPILASVAPFPMESVSFVKPAHISWAVWPELKSFLAFIISRITFDFAFPGSFFCAFTSFLTGEPVKYSIQALSDCSIYFINKQALEALYQKDLKGVWMGKWAAEQQFIKKSAREFSLLTQTAEERYQALLQSQPVMLQHIPLKYLASYIGITPQALSRIRKRIAH